MPADDPTVVSVSTAPGHSFSKSPRQTIVLLAGIGVEGDAHSGATDQHRFHAARDPGRLNLRQVHLIQSELFDELGEGGFVVGPGDLGENVTTSGLDLLSLPLGTRLRLGPDAVVEVTGLRNPCRQIDRFQPGLLKKVIGTDDSGALIRRTGVMSIVVTGGTIGAGDSIGVEVPQHPFEPLGVV